MGNKSSSSAGLKYSVSPPPPVQVEQPPAQPPPPAADRRQVMTVQPVRVNRGSVSPSPARTIPTQPPPASPNQRAAAPSSSLLTPGLRQVLVSPASPSNSSKPQVPRTPSVARDSTLQYGSQAGQFPPVQFSDKTAEWASFLDNYHVDHLINANSATIQEIYSHYDLDANRLLSKSESKHFAQDLINRVCRNFAEEYLKSNRNAKPTLLRKKVQEEKKFMLPGSHKNDEESLKSMNNFIRQTADKNHDGKISNQELNLVFVTIMKQLFAEGTKKKSTDTGMSCVIS